MKLKTSQRVHYIHNYLTTGIPLISSLVSGYLQGRLELKMTDTQWVKIRRCVRNFDIERRAKNEGACEEQLRYLTTSNQRSHI